MGCFRVGGKSGVGSWRPRVPGIMQIWFHASSSTRKARGTPKQTCQCAQALPSALGLLPDGWSQRVGMDRQGVPRPYRRHASPRCLPLQTASLLYQGCSAVVLQRHRQVNWRHEGQQSSAHQPPRLAVFSAYLEDGHPGDYGPARRSPVDTSQQLCWTRRRPGHMRAPTGIRHV